MRGPSLAPSETGIRAIGHQDRDDHSHIRVVISPRRREGSVELCCDESCLPEARSGNWFETRVRVGSAVEVKVAKAPVRGESHEDVSLQHQLR